MTKPKIYAHPSVVIAHCSKTKELLLSVYDAGYFMEKLIFSANVIGGNPNKGDKNPKQTLEREINEEFNPGHGEKNHFNQTVCWAPTPDIRLVRNNLLHNISPISDFYMRVGKLPEGADKSGEYLFSAFYTEINPEIIEIVKKNLLAQKTLTYEGLTGIFTLDDLVNDERGEWATAHITASLLNYYFDLKIPHPRGIHVEKIGDTRNSFQDYFSDFNYQEGWLKI